MEKRRKIFLGESTTQITDIPKGILLIGVQGCEKSLAAKAIAGTWGVPLLRLDMGCLYDKRVGETERKTIESLKMAERMAPCVLWIDEIEKEIAVGDSDNGLSQRVQATILTWMNERKKPVFIVATANEIYKMPPELVRKDRFDEIFFVDLPDKDVRKEIFAIHLQKRRFDPKSFNIDNLAQVTEGFSGSGIEQLIVSSIYSVVGGVGNLTNELLINEIRATKPLSVLMAEHISTLREWAKDRTVPAN